ncbi:hypothetical protein FHS18_004207 [Paenibacillus phyllosphaerae]|uniref:Uncharacterized protein n=1 Tax=Paenibacillus phyllosphaerae TaxID=274593 RepID=A0A7W5B0F5_9BACL|nr:carbohydrate-binding protein [Paenibacillus phyllosphaerae]MBB3112129.1 hypothetical protein [Paenibacillus phyllosphaerae]
MKWGNRIVTSFISTVLVASMSVTAFTFPVAASSSDPTVTGVELNTDSAIVGQPAIVETVSEAGFVHPSIGFSADSLTLMQQQIAIGAEPWASAFETYRKSSAGSLDYDIRNQSKIDPSKPAYTKVDNDAKAKETKVDAEAAYTNAVIWTATGDMRYREKAMKIIRLWSQLDPANPTGFTDSHISIGDAMVNMVRAAELLRYTESEGEWAWTELDTANFTNNFLMAFYDSNFYHSNGRWMNQHGIVTQAYMMAAIFSDNQAWYEEAVEWATTNKSVVKKGQSGDIVNQIRYVTQNERTGEPIVPHVQLVEMGRDMGHASGNTSTLSMIAYMTALQGTKVDPDSASPTFGEITTKPDGVGVFEFLDDRILAGANLLAQYNLGYDIPYTPVNTSNGVIGDASASYYNTVSDNGRGLGYASEVTYGYYTLLSDTPMNPNDERIKYLHQSIEKLGGLKAFPSYVLMQGTADLATGEVVGPPKPLSQPTYAEARAAYNRYQAFDYLGRSTTTSTNIFQDLDGMRSVLYDVRYENQYTWYDLQLNDSYSNITIRAASNSSAGTKVDVILLDQVEGLDRTNVTASDLAKGEVVATLQVPNTGWWTNYTTVSGKLSRPLSGQHLLAFKYYGSTNALSYQIAFDWFSFSDAYAGNENKATDGVLSGDASITSDGVLLNNGGTVSFNNLNYDSGNNSAEFQVKTTDENGKLLLYSEGQLITTYPLSSTSGSLIKLTSNIESVDIGKITGIRNVELKYEGDSPILLKSYRNIERNRLITTGTSSSNVKQIEDQAIAVSGDFKIGSAGQRSYVQASNDSVIYLSQGTLQVDRTKDSIVTFTVKSNKEAQLNLKRDASTAPFAVIHVPDTKDEWLKVSTNISDKYVNPNDYPTNLKSVFLSIESALPNVKLQLDSYELDPAETPPSVKLTNARGIELQSVVGYENGGDIHLQVSVQDPDSAQVLLSSDNPSYMVSSLNGKEGGEITIKTAGLAVGEYAFHLYLQDDTGNYVDKEVKLLLYPEEENHAPTGLTAALTGPTSATLQWTAVKGAAYYTIYRKSSIHGSFVKWSEVTGTTFTDANLSANSTYIYQITAGGNSGETQPSEAVSVSALSKIDITTSMVKASSNVWPGTGTPEENGWLAFDGNTTTATDAVTNPSWILVDLGEGNAQVIGGIKFYPRSTHISRVNGAIIQGSNDGTNFVDLYTISGIGSAKWYFASFSTNSDTAYRYLRYYTSKSNANVAELEFYGKGSEQANEAPVFIPLSPLAISLGQTINQMINASDAAGDAITYAGIDLPASAVINEATGEFTWTPDTAGSYTLQFMATDSKGATVTLSWIIEVTEVTQPELDHSATLSGPIQAAAGQAIDLTIGLHGVTEGYTTAQVVVHYDPDKLAFMTEENDQGQLVLAEEAITVLQEGIQVIGTGVKADKGQMLLIVARTSQDSETADSVDLIVLHGQIQPHAQPGAAVASRLSDVEVSINGESATLDVSQAAWSIQIVEGVSRTQLEQTIQHAQEVSEAAVVGTAPGQYPAGAKSALDMAIATAAAVRDNSAATQEQVNQAVADLNAAITTFQNSVIREQTPSADKEALNDLIQSVQNRLSNTVAGTKIGQYPEQAIAALQAALESAMAVKNYAQATQSSVDEAVAALQLAEETFAHQLVTLVPGQIKVTLNDLSVIAKYYGTKSTDANWSQIEKADLFGAGEITIRELAAVAQMIVEDWLAE